ncbi:hypothetical protein BH18VER1_BH18VER1_03370 [soil metagenome]
MKRFFLSLLVFGICGVTSLFADEAVRAAQSRLKADGFYFGEPTGDYNSETAAAVSRYQIRNGLPITGQLDPETVKALGIAAAPAASSNPDASDTWRRLRKTDERFLQRLNSGQIAPPERNETQGAAQPPQPEPQSTAVPAEASTFVLSRERLRDYVAAFVLAGLDPRIGAELEFFSDRVDYFDSGVLTRKQLRADLQRYNELWPQRQFSLAGEIDVQPQADSRIRVSFPLRFELRNGSRRSSGKVRKTLLLEVTGDDLQIVAVNESKGR